MEKTIIEPKTMVNVQLSKFPGKLNMKPMASPCGLWMNFGFIHTKTIIYILNIYIYIKYIYIYIRKYEKHNISYKR